MPEDQHEPTSSETDSAPTRSGSSAYDADTGTDGDGGGGGASIAARTSETSQARRGTHGDQPEQDTTPPYPEGGDDRPAPDAEEEQESADPAPGHSADALHERPDDAEVDDIQREREERLDDDNRPDNVEVDNSEREFDAEKGMFTDSEGYDSAPTRFPPASEQQM